MPGLGVVRGRRERARLEPGAVKRRHRAPPPEAAGERLGDASRAVARDGDHRHAGRLLLEPAALLQHPGELARHRCGEAGVPLEQGAEAIGVDGEQTAVAERANGRRARLAGQERQLADRRAGTEHAHHSGAVLCVDDDLEATADDDEAGVARIASAEEPLAGVEPDLARVREQLFEHVLGDVCEERREGLRRRGELGHRRSPLRGAAPISTRLRTRVRSSRDVRIPPRGPNAPAPPIVRLVGLCANCRPRRRGLGRPDSL